MKFTESHEWIRILDEEGTVGITDHAQRELGEIVYVELPSVGKKVKAGDEVAVLESTKAASDIYTPVSGQISAVNEALKENPSLINSSSEEKAWLFKISLAENAEYDELLDPVEYESLIGG